MPQAESCHAVDGGYPLFIVIPTTDSEADEARALDVARDETVDGGAGPSTKAFKM